MDDRIDTLQGPATLALRLVVVTFVLLIVGASVRVNGAGLACPDWPLCFGKIIPPMDIGVAFEFGHRVLAGAVSVGYAVLVALMVRARKQVGRPLLLLAGLGVGVLVTQVVLGGLTVLELLAEWTVASHLLVGNLFCVTLLLLALGLRERIRPIARVPVSGALRIFAVVVAVALPTQLVLGGFVSSSHAGLACGTWPTCDGVTYFPTFAGLVGLQLMHRIVAYGLVGLAVAGVLITRGQGRAGRVTGVLLALVLAQAALGVANVLMAMPVEVTLAHTAGAAALMLTVGWLNWEAWRAPLHSASTAAQRLPDGAIFGGAP